MITRELDKYPCLKLKALAGIKDTRRLWQDINPREFIGGLVYDVDSGEVGLVTVDTSVGEYMPKWSDLYLYLIVWDYKVGWIRGGGQFVSRLIPLLPPYSAARMVGGFSQEQDRQRLHAGQWVFNYERTPPPHAEPETPLFEDDGAHHNESNDEGDGHE